MNILNLIDSFKDPTNPLGSDLKDIGCALTLELTVNTEFRKFLDTIQKNNEYAAKTYLISFCLVSELSSTDAIELVEFVYKKLYE